MNALTSERSAHINTASRFQLFSIITKCIHSFSDSMIRKQIGFHQERTSAGKEGQRRTGSLYQCLKEEGGGPEEGGGLKEGGEEVQRMVVVVVPMSDHGQSCKDVRTWRK
jgi:hypothetical protein